VSVDAGGNHHDPVRSAALRPVVLAVRFATELALLAVLAIAGVNASAGLAVRIALAVLGPVLAATIWGIGIAPRARRRWPDPWRIVAEIALFLIAAAALATEGDVLAAVVFAVVCMGTAFAVRVVAPGG
jgi:Protein of unknown function (DUF2568)